MPQIRLLDSEGVAQETLSITKWDTDTIVEFLQTYLEPEVPVPEDATSENEIPTHDEN